MARLSPIRVYNDVIWQSEGDMGSKNATILRAETKGPQITKWSF